MRGAGFDLGRTVVARRQVLMQRLAVLALCVGITWALWRWLGPVAIALCAPLFGLVLANPVLALVGALIPHLPADATLQHLLPGGVRRWRDPDVLRIAAEALATWLAKATDPQTLKVRNWLACEVLFPARRRRQTHQ